MYAKHGIILWMTCHSTFSFVEKFFYFGLDRLEEECFEQTHTHGSFVVTGFNLPSPPISQLP
jgi:hypothetical protein